ncbi:caspase family protein [Longimicrobium sp.]|uniref:caspase family protein n=1 Tax=Longimicrobium sp. TaxID=2029185 RepID=UPI002C2C237E|nr:caspase family protein [Longimicrobium sp.]HSU17504.1 caspase family protein [Longimicrobium sp.]
MARGTSIHIGVNHPASTSECPLSLSEENAWKMAELAHQAGYGAIHVLRGADATRNAVGGLLSAAARALEPGHTLFVSFSGHGSHVPDADGDERDGWDETWCLHDADLIDDELAAIWRVAAPGTRVLVVSESCFGGGMGRYGDVMARYPNLSPALDRPVYRSAEPVLRGVKQFAQPVASCISRAPSHDDGIRASVLMMTGAAEGQRAREGLYTRHLLELWKGGAFRDSFCALHGRLCECVRYENPQQEPQIMMLGTPDPDFPLEMAFHLDRPVMRGGWRD